MVDMDGTEHRGVQRAGADHGHVAQLEDEVLRLGKRCRAHENALAKLAGAVQTLRNANRALNDENVLLRQQIADLTHRASGGSGRRRRELGARALG
jgi:predicted RNase H-like nuclease (RuvC/YqgF family)